MIQPPKPNEGKSALRVIAEALAQAHWVPAALATIYRFTHPSEMEGLLETWRQEVSDGVNDHEARLARLEGLLAPRAEIGELAAELAFWLVRSSEDGLRWPVTFDKVKAAFQGQADDALQEAVFELRHLGLVTVSAAMGYPVRTVNPTYDLFVAFDRMVVGTDPTSDAAELAEMILADERMGSVRKLHDATGWSLRRLNPAVAVLMGMFPEGRVSREVQPRYATTSLLVTAEERFRLRQFVKDTGRMTSGPAPVSSASQ